MSAHDNATSPYLLQPLRSYKEAMRDRAAQIPCKGGRQSRGGPESRRPARPETDDVERPQ